MLKQPHVRPGFVLRIKPLVVSNADNRGDEIVAGSESGSRNRGLSTGPNRPGSRPSGGSSVLRHRGIRQVREEAKLAVAGFNELNAAFVKALPLEETSVPVTVTSGASRQQIRKLAEGVGDMRRGFRPFAFLRR